MDVLTGTQKVPPKRKRRRLQPFAQMPIPHHVCDWRDVPMERGAKYLFKETDKGRWDWEKTLVWVKIDTQPFASGTPVYPALPLYPF